MVDVEHARKHLREERTHLQRQLGEIERGDDVPIDMLGGDAAADTTTATSELNLRSSLAHAIAEIDAALHRIELGTYGIDEETGDPIDPERLDAVPAARTNVK